jgi:2-methylaconitate cis-trans-isomerase PrpF
VTDVLKTTLTGRIVVSIVDAGNAVVFVRARDLGMVGTEISEIDRATEMRQKLDLIRCTAAVMLGLASSPEEARDTIPNVPQIAFVTEPQDYKSVTGRVIKKEDADVVVRTMSMGTLHKAYPVTVAIATSGAAMVENTIVHEMLSKSRCRSEEIRLAHPGGIIPVGALVERKGNSYIYKEALLCRTARRLMDGYVYVPKNLL